MINFYTLLVEKEGTTLLKKKTENRRYFSYNNQQSVYYSFCKVKESRSQSVLNFTNSK